MSNINPAAAATPASAGVASASKLARFSWTLCDASRVPYNVLVNIFVFSAYFTSAVSSNGVEGQARWSFITAVGAIIVALTAPTAVMKLQRAWPSTPFELTADVK